MVKVANNEFSEKRSSDARTSEDIPEVAGEVGPRKVSDQPAVEHVPSPTI